MSPWHAMCLEDEGSPRVQWCKSRNFLLSFQGQGQGPLPETQAPTSYEDTEERATAGELRLKQTEGRAEATGAQCHTWEGLGDSALPRHVKALLIGQLLHVQGHRTCIIAELVVFWDVHVAFCVPCVVGHPDCDWGTCDGHLKATVDGGGRQRERRDTHIWVSSQEPMLSWLSQGLPQRT